MRLMRHQGPAAPRRAGVGRTVVFVLCWLLCMVAAQAQQPTDADTDLDQRLAQVRDRISALKARDDVDSALRDEALETYQQAVSALEAAQSDRRQTEALRKKAAEAPAEIRRINEQMRAIEAAPSRDALEEVATSKLSTRADELDTRLGETQARLSDLRDQLTRLAQRPDAARRELAEARNALQSLDTSVASSSSDEPGASALNEAERSQLSARREALTAEIERLQQELSGLDARERLVEAQRTLAEARLSRDTQALATLQLALAQRQNDTAKTLREQSQDTLTELRGAARPLADAAQRNLELSRELADVTADSERLASRQVERRSDVEDLERRLNLVQRQLEIGGTSVALGDVLRSQKRDLSSPEFAAVPGTGSRAPDIASAELQRFQLQQARVELDDLASRADALVDGPDALNDSQRRSLINLLEQRRDVLDLLVDAEGRYIDIGRDLRSLGEQYEETLGAFERLLDERLFWLPSFDRVGLDWPAAVARDLPWVFDPDGWNSAVAAFVSGVSNEPLAALLAALVVAAMLSVQRTLRARLKRLAEPVGNVRRDTFWVTLRTTLITLLLSLPAALLLVATGLFIRQGSDPAPYALAVAYSAIQLGVLVLFIEPFAQVCRANGLAERHFLWDEAARRGLHRNLRWLLAVLVLPTLVLALTESINEDGRRETLGLAAFVFSSLMIAAFSWRLLHPTRGAISNLADSSDDHWRLGYLWLPLAVGVPLLLSGMALWGYYYTALQLQTRFFYSAALLSGCLILYSLIVRWLTVAERRLALTRALRKREEAREARAREAAAAAGEGAPENLDTLEIDLLQISEQTRGLIKVVITLIIGGGLWLIWSDTLPALQLLDNVTLWQYSTEIEGQNQLMNVTLGALMLALAVGVITALAGRNLPGFLEITILRRFSMDAGSRYAMATLFQYAIVIVGLLVSVSLIGLRWSSIQWLVAAVGVGLGFGLQEIFANFVSGIVILFERPVRVGDTVTVGTLTGTVSRIRIRATTVTDWDNKEVVIPNKTFITETVINWTLTDDITRLILRVQLPLDTDTELVERLISEAIEAEPVALEEPAPSVFLVGYDDGTMTYEARVFYHDLYNLLPLQHALYKRIHAAFADNRVTVSFPQRDLHLRSMDSSFERFGREAGPGGARTGRDDDAPAPADGR